MAVDEVKSTNKQQNGSGSPPLLGCSGSEEGLQQSNSTPPSNRTTTKGKKLLSGDATTTSENNESTNRQELSYSEFAKARSITQLYNFEPFKVVVEEVLPELTTVQEEYTKDDDVVENCIERHTSPMHTGINYSSSDLDRSCGERDKRSDDRSDRSSLFPSIWYPARSLISSMFPRAPLPNNNIARYMDEVVFANPTREFLTKGEFELLLIDHVRDSHMNEIVLDDIFNSCDTEGTGRISKQKLLEYVCNAKRSSKNTWHLVSFIVYKTMVKSVSFWLNIFFLSGALLSIIANVLSRNGDLGSLGNVNYNAIPVWLLLVGTTVFTYSSVERQRENFELEEVGLKMLCKWADQSKMFQPITISRGRQHGFRYPDLLTEEIVEKFIMDDGIGLGDVKRVLEYSSVFLPIHVLESIFGAIDKGRSGLITRDEVKEFLSEYRKRKVTESEKLRVVLKNSFKAWDFWSNFIWSLGSACFVATAHLSVSAIGNSTENLQNYVNGLGSIMYLVGGLNLIPITYITTNRFLSNVQELRHSILMILTGAINEEAQSSTKHNNRHFAEMSLLKHIGHAFHSSSNADSNGDGERSSFNCFELYCVLVDKGVLTPFSVYMSVFKQACTNSDGEIQLEDFKNVMLNFHPYESTLERRLDTVKILPSTIDFWMATFLSAAGALYVVSAYIYLEFPQVVAANDLTLVAMNCNLAASCLYLVSSLNSIANIVFKIWYHRKLVDSSIYKFTSEIAKRSEEWSQLYNPDD